MVRALEERGHRCTLFLYDTNSDDVERHEPVIRSYWPDMKAEIRSARPSIGGVDAVVASAWASAHVAERRTDAQVPRFYFIQDYEPYFYPRGYLYELAQDSYSLGFTHIALGEMVRKSLVHELSLEPATTIPFGCDTDMYGLLKADGAAATPTAARGGVVLYAKTDVHRRGYLLAKAGLELFHQMHPEQEIHVVGDHVTGWRIPVTAHGSLRPQELNALYNRCSAGLALSFTNISLAAEELMAAGCVPVVNDSDLAKADLASPGVLWARATPTGIAGALARIVEHPHPELQAREVAALPRKGWGISQQRFSSFIESSLTAARVNSWTV
ncbi:glycosyltransferase family 1 protein [Arthrobacter sp. NPDC089319]|uniref:rhamnosyltransferase WsaF family glycosyltransferase n=1 Tax=Arthrobacter sp. NPDC089319 TaxID=3155915 RepID=UPI00341BE7F3